jgi:hypothetical protein
MNHDDIVPIGGCHKCRVMQGLITAFAAIGMQFRTGPCVVNDVHPCKYGQLVFQQKNIIGKPKELIGDGDQLVSVLEGTSGDPYMYIVYK